MLRKMENDYNNKSCSYLSVCSSASATTKHITLKQKAYGTEFHISLSQQHVHEDLVYMSRFSKLGQA